MVFKTAKCSSKRESPCKHEKRANKTQRIIVGRLRGGISVMLMRRRESNPFSED